jgi:hypothetical protein
MAKATEDPFYPRLVLLLVTQAVIDDPKGEALGKAQSSVCSIGCLFVFFNFADKP